MPGAQPLKHQEINMKIRIILTALIMLAIAVFLYACGGPQEMPVTITPLPDAAQWRAYYFDKDQVGMTVKVVDRALKRVFNQPGTVGIYNTQAISGNFEVISEIDFLEGYACGIMLIKDKYGVPDAENYVGLKRYTTEGGQTRIEVIGKENGEDLIKKNSFWRAKYGYNLGRDKYGYKAKALRIVKDEKGGCLHFYYLYDREIDGKVSTGWMEFSTLPDSGNDKYYLYLYITQPDEGKTKVVFTNPQILKTPADDRADADTGFKATRRDYTFSGFSNDAIVITFDEAFDYYKTAKFVFWRDANYIPWWHIDDTCAVSYEFCETWEGGTRGCAEPMSDKLCRWSKAEILESNAARVVVHWQYVLADPDYNWWGRSETQKPIADEYFTFYPDGVGVRKLTYTPVITDKYPMNWNEISEIMTITRAGVLPSSYLKETALSAISVKGEQIDFLWDLSKEKPPAKMDDKIQYWDEAIWRVNLKEGRPSPFEVFAQGEEHYKKTFPYPMKDWWGNYGADWAFEMRGGYEFEGDFWTFSHWPISKRPYDEPVKTNGKFIREPSHTSLLPVAGHPAVTGVTTWAMLVGLAEPDNKKEVIDSANSWLYPGKVEILYGACEFIEVDYYQRAMVFNSKHDEKKCHFTLTPSEGKTTINPVFIIDNWGDNDINIRLNSKALKEHTDFRYDIVDNKAVIWVNKAINKKAEFLID